MRTLLVSLGTLVVVAWGAAGAEAQSAPAVSGYTLVSSQRVTRTVSDFTYRARLTNPLPRTLPAATATLTSHAPATQVIDGALSFGDVGPGATATSLDTFTIRQDRTLPFDPASLVWAVGVQLGGAAGQPALDAAFDLPPPGVPAAEIEVAGPGRRVARTLVEIAFVPGATTAEINALLASVGGRIVSMLEGVAIVVVRIPDPGSLTGLDGVVAQLQGHPLVRRVTRATLTEPDVLPANVAAQGQTALSAVRHQLAVRGHAAWNARAALPPLGDLPLLVVVDAFGAGPPNADFATLELAADFSTGGLVEHGYHVLGIITGAFEGAADDRGFVTGMFPAPVQLRAVDRVLSGGGSLTAPEKQNAIIQIVKASGLGVVVNTSQNDCVGLATCGDPAAASAQAVAWIEKVRGTGGLLGLFGGPDVEDRFVQITSSGNVQAGAPGIVDAETNSAWSAARLLPGLETTGVLGAQAVANLTNTLVVDNAVVSATQPFRPTCLQVGSKRTGDLAGIGTDVWSFTGPTTGAGFKTGTSMATPQVAGLAAYVWALNPLLAPQQVVEILLSTARQQADLTGSTDCDPTTLPAPQIDAYAAVLAVDDASALTPGGGPLLAPVRLAVLDAADETGAPGQDGVFDERDINLFLVELDLAAGAIDYSRYDLNGDGRTGSAATDRFDLSIDGTYGTVTQSIEEQDVTFAEGLVTDIGVLCYYAYSLLYTGDPDARRDLLSGRCLPGMQVVVLGQEPGEESSRTALRASGNVGNPDAITELALEEAEPPLVLTAASGPASMTLAVTMPQPNVVAIFTAASASAFPCPSLQLCAEAVGLTLNTSAVAQSTLRLSLPGPGLLDLAIDPAAFVTAGGIRARVAAENPLVPGGTTSFVEVVSFPDQLSAQVPIAQAGTYFVNFDLGVRSRGLQGPGIMSGTVLTVRFTPTSP